MRPAAADSLERDLRRRLGDAVVRFDAGARGLYASDASNYRQVPIGVVLPRTVDDLVAAVAVCREHGAPVLPRGTGTSIAGQACNVAVVLDTTRHLTRILEIDPDGRIARVEPGVVLDDLRVAAGRFGLTFGPDPSTHNRCTLGGMIGNNACGLHSVAYGKTADNVESLDVLLYDGTRMQAGPAGAAELDRRAAAAGREGELYRQLRGLRDRYLADLRTAFPQLPRRVSGYNLDQLLPERQFHLARALAGTEGTCATTLGATLRLVERPAARCLLAVGFADLPSAADHVPALLPFGPLGLEGMGDGLVECLLAHNPHRRGVLDLLPEGRGWLLAEFGGQAGAEARERAAQALAGLRATGMIAGQVVTDPVQQQALWRIREEGSGFASRLPDGTEAWPGWEDAAVPPERLGAYLRDFDALLASHRRHGVPYGHFGDGCIHVRIDFDLLSGTGVAGYRRFLEDAADLVVRYGGSLSGEHGDGQARAELLSRMYPAPVIDAFAAFKAAWDPLERMNPGKVVRPRPLDADLRPAAARSFHPVASMFGYPHDGGEFTVATRRCIGVAKCRQTGTGVMCPSYMVTRDELHSTRGRARLLYEMLRGEIIGGGWRSEEVRDALDLCLACKACRSECPVNVDMATYKAEFLHHHYRHRRRPVSHYSMGWLPLWARVAARAPGLANAVAGHPAAARIVKRAGGIASERRLPTFAGQSFTAWFRNCAPHLADGGGGAPVVLWPDTFTNFFEPHIARAAVGVLADAGFSVQLPPWPVCCGLPWVSTGQLGVAKQVLRRTLRTIGSQLAAGIPVLVLEPSCAAVFRSDLPELLPGNAEAGRLSQQTFTLAELLSARAPLWAPSLAPTRAMVQVHCHQSAVLGFDADRALLSRAGVQHTVLDSGCCGLAGNFGFERGHFGVSMACAERVLLPAVRGADHQTTVIADGFSCRVQIRHGSGREALHLAQVLRGGQA